MSPLSLIEDAIIAATDAVHDLTLVTRNLRYFKGFGIRTLDPSWPEVSGA